jgi:hypothetical protein
MRAGDFVLVHLAGPKEQFWGRLLELGPMGVAVRGIHVESFEDWARQVGRREERTMDVVEVFFPMHRVEKMFRDEDMGVLPSYHRQFKTIAGMEALDYFENFFSSPDPAD